MLRLWSLQYIYWNWVKCVYYGGYWRQTRFRLKQIHLKTASFINNIIISLWCFYYTVQKMIWKTCISNYKGMFKWDLLWNYKFHVLYLTCGQYSRDAGVRSRFESGSLVFNHMTLRVLLNLWVEGGVVVVTCSLGRELYLFKGFLQGLCEYFMQSSWYCYWHINYALNKWKLLYLATMTTGLGLERPYIETVIISK